MKQYRTQYFGWSRWFRRHAGQFAMMISSLVGTSLVVLLRAGLSLWELLLFWTTASAGLALILLLVGGYTLVFRHWRGH